MTLYVCDSCGAIMIAGSAEARRAVASREHFKGKILCDRCGRHLATQERLRRLRQRRSHK